MWLLYGKIWQEEVWEVAAELVGLGLGILALVYIDSLLVINIYPDIILGSPQSFFDSLIRTTI